MCFAKNWAGLPVVGRPRPKARIPPVEVPTIKSNNSLAGLRNFFYMRDYHRRDNPTNTTPVDCQNAFSHDYPAASMQPAVFQLSSVRHPSLLLGRFVSQYCSPASLS